MNESHHRIVHIELVEPHVIRRNADIEHERAVAIFDLLDENRFALADDPAAGPFRVFLAIEDNRLVFDVRTEADAELTKVQLPLTPFRGIVKDYFLICDSYFKAIRSASPTQIEAIDMGRRGIHNEGADLLTERLAGKITVDKQTSRRLFTLLCVLHIRG